jgi:thiol-disulfide isomerase/thioredoxin
MNTSNDKTTGPAGLRRLVAVLFAVAIVATACSSGSDTISLGDDPLAPSIEAGDVDSGAQGDVVNFTYDTFDDERAEFADLPDGPVVLNFFASWCPTCISELPDFQTVSENLADEVTFLGLAVQDRSENSVQLVADTGITYPVGRDQNGSIFAIFEGLAMPTTVFLDADHQVVRVHSGVFDVESLTETINSDLLT